MNSNDKSRVGFLALIPLFFIITLIIVDTLFSYIEDNRYKKISENIVKEVLNNDELDDDEYYEEIKKIYERNGYETEMLVVENDRYSFYLENEHAYFGIFSSFSTKKSVESEVQIFGLTFKVKKNSVARIKVNATKNGEEIKFEYTE